MNFRHFISSALIPFLKKNVGGRTNEISEGGFDYFIGIDFSSLQDARRNCPNSRKSGNLLEQGPE